MNGGKYSKKLIDRTIAYFKKKYDKDISSEVANEYLNSFSGLFLAFTSKKDDKPRPAP